MYSVKSGKGWVRAGTKICYFSTKTPVNAASSGGTNKFGLTAAATAAATAAGTSTGGKDDSDKAGAADAEPLVIKIIRCIVLFCFFIFYYILFLNGDRHSIITNTTTKIQIQIV